MAHCCEIFLQGINVSFDTYLSIGRRFWQLRMMLVLQYITLAIVRFNSTRLSSSIFRAFCSRERFGAQV